MNVLYYLILIFSFMFAFLHCAFGIALFFTHMCYGCENLQFLTCNSRSDVTCQIFYWIFNNMILLLGIWVLLLSNRFVCLILFYELKSSLHFSSYTFDSGKITCITNLISECNATAFENDDDKYFFLVICEKSSRR